MTEVLKAMWNDEAGQGLVEYALIIALVSIGLILALTVLRNSIATEALLGSEDGKRVFQSLLGSEAR